MKDLFGNEVIKKPVKKKTNQAAVNAHAKLIQIHGSHRDNRCKKCEFFVTKQYAGTYFKCSKFSTKGSQSSDWRANWKACGLFKKEL